MRDHSQEQTINYVKNERTKIAPNIFQFGTPKKHSSQLVRNDYVDLDDQRLLLNQRLKENFYQQFEDIEKDWPLLFIKYPEWCRNLWDRYHPVNQLELNPARVLWIYGGSVSGKSHWVKKCLRSAYKNSDIAVISQQNMTYPDKIYFSTYHQNCKVLVINEVDKNFPKYNNLVAFIDRNTFLETKKRRY